MPELYNGASPYSTTFSCDIRTSTTSTLSTSHCHQCLNALIPKWPAQRLRAFHRLLYRCSSSSEQSLTNTTIAAKESTKHLATSPQHPRRSSSRYNGERTFCLLFDSAFELTVVLRVRTLNEPLPPPVITGNEPYRKNIQTQFTSVCNDL